MHNAMIWVLSFTVLGPVSESGELAKYKTKEECLVAMQQKREEYQAKKQKIAANCSQSTRNQ